MSNAIQGRRVPLEFRPTATNLRLMIDSVTIKNFRCFKNAEAKNLGLVNIIVGGMASGKTTFLETLFLTATNRSNAHEAFFHWRGSGDDLSAVMSAGYKSGSLASGEYWLDMFHWYDSTTPIEIEFTGTIDRKVLITIGDPVDRIVEEGALQDAPVLFEWWHNGDRTESQPRYSESTLENPLAGPSSLYGAMIPQDVPKDWETAERYSNLDVEGKAGGIADALKSWYPEVDGLSLQSEGAGAVLYVNHKSSGRKYPLSLVSSGISKLVSILVAIARYPGGLVLVDEIGAGIYHAQLENLWQVLFDFAEANETQLFLTTHSSEVLNALLPTIKKREDQFRLVRVTRDSEQSLSTLRVSSGAGLGAAIKENMEVR